MSKTVTKFTIDRNIWLRGEGEDRSYLLRPADGKMCCVGIYLAACGVPREELSSRQSACALGVIAGTHELPEEARWLLAHGVSGMPSQDATQLYADNDGEWETPVEREERIRGAFARHGIVVEFV